MANTVRRPPSRIAPTFTLLFAGMVAGVLVGLVALLPSSIAQRSPSPAFDQVLPAMAVAVAPTTEPVVAPLPATPPSPATPPPAEDATPAVELHGVPSSAIDREQTLVTFLPVADGERVLVDGHPITTADPTKMRCGKHTIRIGAGVKRRVSFPCGGALTLD
jgi:hypothetical protein